MDSGNDARNAKTRLQGLRVAAGYKSAKEFAEAHGIAVATYTNYEQGRKMPIDLIWKLADEFGVTIDYLVGRDFEDGPGTGPDAAITEPYSRLDGVGKVMAAAAVRGMADYMDEVTGKGTAHGEKR